MPREVAMGADFVSNGPRWTSLPGIPVRDLRVLGLVLAYATQARSLTGHLAHVAGPTRAFFAWIVKLLAPG